MYMKAESLWGCVQYVTIKLKDKPQNLVTDLDWNGNMVNYLMLIVQNFKRDTWCRTQLSSTYKFGCDLSKLGTS